MKKTEIVAASVGQTEEVIRLPFTEGEILDKKDKFAAKLMALEDLQSDFDRIKADFKFKMDVLKSDSKVLLHDIRLGYIDKTMTVHNVPNDDDGVVEFYDVETGELVGSRKVRGRKMRTLKANNE